MTFDLASEARSRESGSPEAASASHLLTMRNGGHHVDRAERNRLGQAHVCKHLRPCTSDGYTLLHIMSKRFLSVLCVYLNTDRRREGATTTTAVYKVPLRFLFRFSFSRSLVPRVIMQQRRKTRYPLSLDDVHSSDWPSRWVVDGRDGVACVHCQVFT